MLATAVEGDQKASFSNSYYTIAAPLYPWYIPPWLENPTNTCVWHTGHQTAISTLLGLIRSPPLEIEPTTTGCRGRNSTAWPLVHATQKWFQIN